MIGQAGYCSREPPNLTLLQRVSLATRTMETNGSLMLMSIERNGHNAILVGVFADTQTEIHL